MNISLRLRRQDEEPSEPICTQRTLKSALRLERKLPRVVKNRETIGRASKKGETAEKRLWLDEFA